MPRSVAFALSSVLAGLVVFSPGSSGFGPSQGTPAAKSQQLPPVQVLGRGAVLRRDPISGELYPFAPTGVEGSGDKGISDPAVIRSHVGLVQVACTVTAPDGTQVRGLTAENFRLFEDGQLQSISSFDASVTSASVALILDASPSIFRELAEMRDAAHALAGNLSPSDEIAVVSFSSDAHVLLPFSTNRGLLDRALDSKNLSRVEDSSESKIYQAVFLTARELFRGRTGRKAIVLLTDGQDSGLGLTWDPVSATPLPGGSASKLAFDDIARELGADGIALFIVSTENRPRAMTAAWFQERQSRMLVTPEARRQEIPLYTLYLVELARRVGAQVYFLHEIGNLSTIYRRIAQTISAQYTLGYYPSAGTTRPGWRSLRVELAAVGQGEGTQAPPGLTLSGSTMVGSTLAHRLSYYVSAFQ